MQKAREEANLAFTPRGNSLHVNLGGVTDRAGDVKTPRVSSSSHHLFQHVYLKRVRVEQAKRASLSLMCAFARRSRIARSSLEQTWQTNVREPRHLVTADKTIITILLLFPESNRPPGRSVLLYNACNWHVPRQEGAATSYFPIKYTGQRRNRGDVGGSEPCPTCTPVGAALHLGRWRKRSARPRLDPKWQSSGAAEAPSIFNRV